MTTAHLQEIEKQYIIYLKVIKPLLAEIESCYEKFPTPIYNELRAFLDHISRCYRAGITNKEITNQINKASGHITRIILDCYKFLNVFYHDKVEKFEKQTKRIDLTAINNGEFYIEYKKLKNKAVAQVRYAKEQENRSNLDIPKYHEYEEAYNIYRDLDEYISDNMSNIRWARVKFYSNSFFGLLGWIISIILGAILTNNNLQIIEAISKFIN